MPESTEDKPNREEPTARTYAQTGMSTAQTGAAKTEHMNWNVNETQILESNENLTRAPLNHDQRPEAERKASHQDERSLPTSATAEELALQAQLDATGQIQHKLEQELGLSWEAPQSQYGLVSAGAHDLEVDRCYHHRLGFS